jgi:hypothetical protein
MIPPLHALRSLLLAALLATPVPSLGQEHPAHAAAAALPRTPSPAGAAVYIISPQNGAELNGPGLRTDRGDGEVRAVAKYPPRGEGKICSGSGGGRGTLPCDPRGAMEQWIRTATCLLDRIGAGHGVVAAP